MYYQSFTIISVFSTASSLANEKKNQRKNIIFKGFLQAYIPSKFFTIMTDLMFIFCPIKTADALLGKMGKTGRIMIA